MTPEEKQLLEDTNRKLTEFLNMYHRTDMIDQFYHNKPLVLNRGMVVLGDMPLFLRRAPNYQKTESGSNNAISITLTDAMGNQIPLTDGLEIKILLAHSLQAGANTLSVNGTSKNIKSHRNPANNIGTAYVAGGIIHLMYDAANTVWQDMSQ